MVEGGDALCALADREENGKGLAEREDDYLLLFTGALC
jgi:hypothetical protein